MWSLLNPRYLSRLQSDADARYGVRSVSVLAFCRAAGRTLQNKFIMSRKREQTDCRFSWTGLALIFSAFHPHSTVWQSRCQLNELCCKWKIHRWKRQLKTFPTVHNSLTAEDKLQPWWHRVLPVLSIQRLAYCVRWFLGSTLSAPNEAKYRYIMLYLPVMGGHTRPSCDRSSRWGAAAAAPPRAAHYHALS